jgi:hypothetical protein
MTAPSWTAGIIPATNAVPDWYDPVAAKTEARTATPTGVGHALTAYRMPIEGRDEWIAAVERLA